MSLENREDETIYEGTLPDACRYDADLSGLKFESRNVGLDLCTLHAPYAKFENVQNIRCNFNHATLHYAEGRYSDFSRSSFVGAKLTGSCFYMCNFTNANFSGADLSGATFSHCDLRRATFDVDTRLSWQSHDLIAEILRRAAYNCAEQLQVAGMIAMARDWCWDGFLSLEHEERDWAINALAPWVEHDSEAPKQLRSNDGTIYQD